MKLTLQSLYNSIKNLNNTVQKLSKRVSVPNVQAPAINAVSERYISLNEDIRLNENFWVEILSGVHCGVGVRPILDVDCLTGHYIFTAKHNCIKDIYLTTQSNTNAILMYRLCILSIPEGKVETTKILYRELIPLQNPTGGFQAHKIAFNSKLEKDTLLQFYLQPIGNVSKDITLKVQLDYTCTIKE